MIQKAACVIACGFFISGCASLLHSPEERAEVYALGAGFERVQIDGSELRVYLRLPSGRAADRGRLGILHLEIHVESDGAPWLTADSPPVDPTPRSLISLQLAANDPSTVTAYIGRPCQYLDGAALARCDSSLWRQARYGEGAVAAVGRVVDELVRRLNPDTVAMVGYSGGGVIAAHIAARRSDVACLVTIAAPLDIHAWTRAIGVSTLTRSLNPADRPAQMRQTHFTGAADVDVPPESIHAYLVRAARASTVQVPGFDHQCCWARDWTRLRARSCLSG